MEPSSDRDGPTLGRDALAYADTLYNLARHLAGNTADAEDLVQDTYRRAIQAGNQFTPGSNPKGWLFRIFRDTIINPDRKERPNPKVGWLQTVGSNTPEHRPQEWARGGP